MESRLAALGGRIFEEWIDNDANSWGYMTVGDAVFIPISFANVGLLPQAFIQNEIIVIGISGVLLAYSLKSGKVMFVYKMPTIFHEFVLRTDSFFIIRDEISFICLSYCGDKKWLYMCDDIIDEYHIDNEFIFGITMEGVNFKFKII
jgi:hypothetical protein